MSSVNGRSFTFIPVDCRSKSAQEAIRAHIMRGRHRQTRSAKKLLPVQAPQKRVEQQIHFWEQLTDQARVLDDSVSPDSERSSSTLSPQYLDPTLGPNSDYGSPGGQLLRPSNSGTTSLETSNHEFNSNVTDQGEVEDMLIQYYIQYGGGSDVPHHLLRTYRETTGTFSAFLAMIATNYSDERGRSPPLDIAELENKALQEVSTQIAHSPTIPASSTMVTVAMLANIRESRQELDLVDCHWSALKKMVDINGGMNRLRMHQDLFAFLLWIEVVVLSKTSVSVAQLPQMSMHVITMQQEFRELFGELRQSVRNMESAMQDSSPKLTSSILAMFRLLPHKGDAYSMRKWRRARLACLLFFAVLCHQDECPLDEDLLYLSIETEIDDRGKKYTVYPEELFFVIARMSNQDSRCELIWKATRLICVVKQLSQRDINTCQRLLMAYLGLSTHIDLAMALEEWDELYTRMNTPV